MSATSNVLRAMAGIISTAIQEPSRGSRDPFIDRDWRLPAQQAAGFGDVDLQRIAQPRHLLSLPRETRAELQHSARHRQEMRAPAHRNGKFFYEFRRRKIATVRNQEDTSARGWANRKN